MKARYAFKIAALIVLLSASPALLAQEAVDVERLLTNGRFISMNNPTLTDAEVDALLKVLNETDARRRYSAASALMFNKYPRAAEALKSLISSDNPTNLRILGIHAHLKYGDEKTMEILVDLLGDKDPEVRGHAASTLARANDPKFSDQLLKMLEEDEINVRRDIAAGLCTGPKDERFVIPLMRSLNESHPSVKDTFARALSRYIEEPRVLELALSLSRSEIVAERQAATVLLAASSEAVAAKALSLLVHDIDSSVRVSAAKARLEAAPAADKIKACLEFLNSPDSETRIMAASTLQDCRETFIIPSLVAALGDTEIRVVQIASSRLLFSDYRSAGPFLQLAESPDAQRRRMAAEAFKKIQDPGAIDMQIRMLKDASQEVRILAIEGLARFRNEPGVLDALAGLMDDPDEKIRHMGFKWLSIANDTRAIQPLLAMLKSDNSAKRAEAVNSLRNFMGNPDILQALMDAAAAGDAELRKHIISCFAYVEGPRISSFVANYIKDEDVEVRMQAALRMSNYGKPGEFAGNADLLEALNECLKSEDTDIRLRAVRGLVALGDTQAKRRIIELFKDEKQFIRSEALIALRQLGDKEHRELVLELIDDPSYGVRNNVVEYLDHHDERNREIFARMLADTSENVRVTVGRKLQYMNDKRGTDALLEELIVNRSGAAASALGASKDPRVFDALMTALKSDRQDLRWSAAHALGFVGDARAIEPLLEVLNESDPYMKSSAAGALGHLRAKSATAPLLELLTHDSPDVSSAALHALERIGAIGDDH